MRAADMLPDWLQPLELSIADVGEHLPGAVLSGLLFEAHENAVLLEIPEIARMIIERGRITMQPLSHYTPARLGFHLRRTPLAILTLMRGGFSCNAAAVAGPNGAVLLIGTTATGKSALAAALLQRGLTLMADDAAPLILNADGRVMVMPVWPELVLWPDAVDCLLPQSRQWLHRLGDSSPPLWRVDAAHFNNVPLRIHRSYVLQNGDTTLAQHAVRGAARLISGSLLPYQPDLAMLLVDPARLLTIHGGLGPVEKVALPHHALSEIEELADRIVGECG